MIRINFFGGSSVGKSTLAARLYAQLSQDSVSVELVREYVKDWAYEGREPDGWNQVTIFGNQLQAEHRLAKAGVRVIVSDSPLALQCVYTKFKNVDIAYHLHEIAWLWEQQHPSLNFFVKRTVLYEPMGRFACDPEPIDQTIKEFLNMFGGDCHTVVPDDWDRILTIAKERIGR